MEPDATLGTDAAAAAASARRARRARAPRRGRRATPTCGPARPRAPTASRRWRWPPRGPSARGSAPASSACSPAGRRCSPSRPPALADASGGRFALGIGASSDRIVEGWNRMPFERPLTQGVGDGRLPARASSPASAPTAASSSSSRRPSRSRSSSRRCAARCCGSRSRRATARSRTSCRSAACRRWSRRSRGRPEGFELLCRFFCLAGRARAGRAAGAVHVRLLRHGARSTRRSSAGSATATQIDEMVAAWNAKDRERGRPRRAVGADRGHLHLRRRPRRCGSGSTPTSRAGSRCRCSRRSRRPDRLGELIEALAPR